MDLAFVPPQKKPVPALDSDAVTYGISGQNIAGIPVGVDGIRQEAEAWSGFGPLDAVLTGPLVRVQSGHVGTHVHTDTGAGRKEKIHNTNLTAQAVAVKRPSGLIFQHQFGQWHEHRILTALVVGNQFHRAQNGQGIGAGWGVGIASTAGT